MPASRGMTLMEILIAIVILSIGLLGIAGLQAATAKYKINTWSRSAASGLVSDIAERIRINPDGIAGNYNNGVDDSGASAYKLTANWATQQADDVQGTWAAAKQCEAAGIACTVDERAAYDLAVWRKQVRDSIPQGAAQIAGGKHDGVRVTLMWYDKDFLKADSDGKFTELDQSPVCADDSTGMKAQSCCPQATAAPDGVRCANFVFIP
ncbi:type IV pilus modification protein PilV [Ramlibacter sp. H39-3-26]|uniref:type IV pilus modification protein PilV n=1 Tax=Curvibacter soli TaxID=3031331 RepID=UPI0023DBD36E|nr:type IV pilus modification protein PilV [Ramlibacter sp. H39-3-26]MDF1483654.1 type IV pilus modification protein PilV [Ramlibacter sp. H39-3-26]